MIYCISGNRTRIFCLTLKSLKQSLSLREYTLALSLQNNERYGFDYNKVFPIDENILGKSVSKFVPISWGHLTDVYRKSVDNVNNHPLSRTIIKNYLLQNGWDPQIFEELDILEAKEKTKQKTKEAKETKQKTKIEKPEKAILDFKESKELELKEAKDRAARESAKKAEALAEAQRLADQKEQQRLHLLNTEGATHLYDACYCYIAAEWEDFGDYWVKIQYTRGQQKTETLLKEVFVKNSQKL